MRDLGTFTDAQNCMDAIKSAAFAEDAQAVFSYFVMCNFGINQSVSGGLYSGTYLIFGCRAGNYVGLVAISYWSQRILMVANIENGAWVKRFENIIAQTDVKWTITLDNHWAGNLVCTANLITGSVTIGGYIDGSSANNDVFCRAETRANKAYSAKAAVLNTVATQIFATVADKSEIVNIGTYKNGDVYYLRVPTGLRGVYHFSIGYTGQDV